MRPLGCCHATLIESIFCYMGPVFWFWGYGWLKAQTSGSSSSNLQNVKSWQREHIFPPFRCFHVVLFIYLFWFVLTRTWRSSPKGGGGVGSNPPTHLGRVGIYDHICFKASHIRRHKSHVSRWLKVIFATNGVNKVYFHFKSLVVLSLV